MNTALIIIILILGVVLLALEIVALPGGVAGFFGLLLISVGVWQSYSGFGNTVGTIILLCAIALCVLMLLLFMKTKTWQRFSLKEESGSKVNQLEPAVKTGTRGVTISRLAPTGKALIDGEQMEVHAVNKFIDPDRPIEVVATEGYRIDVREVDDNRFEN
jgi:membrane-bound ClpP family serine protease